MIGLGALCRFFCIRIPQGDATETIVEFFFFFSSELTGAFGWTLKSVESQQSSEEDCLAALRLSGFGHFKETGQGGSGGGESAGEAGSAWQ